MLPQSKRKSAASFKNLLKRSNNLQLFKEKIDYSAGFKRQINKILNFTPLQAEYYHLASHEKQVLTFHTTLASQASQIRLMKKQIIAELNQSSGSRNGSPIKDIRAFVRPNFEKKLAKQSALRKLSKENASLLESCSETIDDPELKSAILRLAKNSKSTKIN